MFNDTPARNYAPGMGEAVADRTINRKMPNGKREKWSDVAKRVSIGNALLHPDSFESEFSAMHKHLRKASLLMSGRHLQHGDESQPTRNMEVFTNCSTAATSFLSFYLLLNGSGVGRAYDDNMMKVDWNKMPIVVPVISQTHADVQSGEIKFSDEKAARHFYTGKQIIHFMVPDSREGWAKSIEHLEMLTFNEKYRDHVLLLDFSDVRPRGAPIGGMQNRPASGPDALMTAIANVSHLRDAGLAPWRATLYVDHYFAECVLVGGARRAARMATKNWRDKTVLEFVAIKQSGHLWSSNNSVTVDAKWRRYVKKVHALITKQTTGAALQSSPIASSAIDNLVDRCLISDLEAHAYKVFLAIVTHSYKDGSGEPGIINQDKLTFKTDGVEELIDGKFAESARYKLEEGTLVLTKALAKAFVKSPYKTITNPCGEIVLIMLGGYCVIADVVPFHAAPKKNPYRAYDEAQLVEWDFEATDAFKVATRALMRVNLMDSLYKKEVTRTNRIGVGFTGIHEYAWARFGFGWKDLVDEEKSLPFWKMMSRFKRAVQDEAKEYAAVLGVNIPHTDTTVKPAGTTSKLFGLTEGAHLPSMREFVRWVQFRSDDPLLKEYEKKGYPLKTLTTYGGTTIVGFPTAPTICELGMGDKLVTAPEATPEEQYQWLRLLEKWWITGVEIDGFTPLSESGNQVSYTLKYNPKVVSYDDFIKAMMDGQGSVRCCSVMPTGDTSAYEYLPEEAVNRETYERICNAIERAASPEDELKEDVGLEHVDCSTGACPISFNDNHATAA